MRTPRLGPRLYMPQQQRHHKATAGWSQPSSSGQTGTHLTEGGPLVRDDLQAWAARGRAQRGLSLACWDDHHICVRWQWWAATPHLTMRTQHCLQGLPRGGRSWCRQLAAPAEGGQPNSTSRNPAVLLTSPRQNAVNTGSLPKGMGSRDQALSHNFHGGPAYRLIAHDRQLALAAASLGPRLCHISRTVASAEHDDLESL